MPRPGYQGVPNAPRELAPSRPITPIAQS